MFGDSYFADDNECEDFKKINEIDAPIKLPMDDGGEPIGEELMYWLYLSCYCVD